MDRRSPSVWLRRLLYIFLFLVWLAVMAFPIIAAVLAMQGQIQIGDEADGRHLRLFLVQESDQEGVGIEWTRPAAAEQCRQGNIVYLMWEGAGDNASYCRCVDETGSVISSGPGRCAPP